ncbi:MAG TPA: hypothetical protein PL029_07300, partial [Bacteroidia bacterium]|nr:hypothetical protein [Bacteroidia bacterium]
MKKNVSGFLLLCQLFYAAALLAQNSYSFSKTTGNLYADLDSDTTVPGFDPGTGLFTFTNFQNETFKIFDLDFTFGGLKTISMGEYPFLRIDNDSSIIIVDAAFAYIDPI